MIICIQNEQESDNKNTCSQVPESPGLHFITISYTTVLLVTGYILPFFQYSMKPNFCFMITCEWYVLGKWHEIQSIDSEPQSWNFA